MASSCNPVSISRSRWMAFLTGVLLVLAWPCAVRAAQNREPALRFGLLADVQYVDHEPRGNRHYCASLEKLAACVADLNRQKLAFVVHLGDFIDGKFASFDKVGAIFSRLRMPRYHVLGNHDFAVARDKRSLVPAKLDMPGRYYDFLVKDCRFIVLDGMDVSFLGAPEGSEKHRQAKAIYEKLKRSKAYNAVTWNGAIGRDQRTWLRGRLEHAQKNGERVILFCHMPVYPPNVHNLWNSDEVVTLIESYPCVVAFINGHNHAGNYAERNGVHYLTLHGMVDTPTTPAYAVVEVFPDRLEVTGTGREPSRTLMLRRGTGKMKQ